MDHDLEDLDDVDLDADLDADRRPASDAGADDDVEYEYEYVYDDDDDGVDDGYVYEDEEGEDYVYVGDEPGWGRRFAVIGLFFVIFIVGVVGYAGYWLRSRIDPGGSTEQVVLVIPPDSGLATISRLLEEKEIVTDATIFRYYAKYKGIQTVKAGTYDQLYKRDSMDRVIDRLNQGPLPPKFIDVNFPEGLWVSDVRARLAEKLPEMNPAEFDLAISGPARSKYQPAGAPVDGFLFPATYRIAETDRDNEIALALQMVQTFDRVADEEGMADPDAKLGNIRGAAGLTAYDIVKVASLIEGEAKIPEERAKVARVVYNRLRDGMTLGIDAAIFVALGEHKTELTKTDLEVDSPYNLRIHEGLPPTPINSPGRDSLTAALNPSTEPGADRWLYYVLVDKEGHHFFTNNYNEFLREADKARANGVF